MAGRGLRCIVCGGPAGQCQQDYLEEHMGLEVNKDERTGGDTFTVPERTEYTDAQGVTRLLYPKGAVIPLEDAQRHGLVGKAHQAPPEHQAATAAPEDKAAKKAPAKRATKKKAPAKKAAAKKAPAKEA